MQSDTARETDLGSYSFEVMVKNGDGPLTLVVAPDSTNTTASCILGMSIKGCLFNRELWLGLLFLLALGLRGDVARAGFVSCYLANGNVDVGGYGTGG
jgi:hypothetical protein